MLNRNGTSLAFSCLEIQQKQLDVAVMGNQ